MPKIPIPGRVERGLDGALDKALDIEGPVLDRYLARIRRSRPDASPAEIVEVLEDRYRKAAVGIGVVSGASATVPGVGTATSIAAAGGEVAGFVMATAFYVLGLARVHGVPIHDREVRRALVLGVLLGDTAAAAAGGAALAEKHWAEVIARRGSKQEVSGLNGRLTRMILTRFTARQAGLMLGRAIPLGIGAGVGALGNAALARAAIRSARRAFGPVPTTFGPAVIDGQGEDSTAEPKSLA